MALSHTHAVPDVDSHRGATINEAVGNPNDTEQGKSLSSRTYIALAHVNSIVRCLPADGEPVAIEADATPRVLGMPVELVAEGSMDIAIDFTHLTACATAPGHYTLCLRAQGTVIADYALDAIALLPAQPPATPRWPIGSQMPIGCPPIPIGHRVTAEARSDEGGGGLLIRLQWFPYIPLEDG